MTRTSKRNPDFDRMLGGFINKMRKDKKWSLLNLNQRAGLQLTKSALSGIERGVQQLTTYQIFLLSKALNFSVDYFFGGAEMKKFLPQSSKKIKILIDGKILSIDDL